MYYSLLCYYELFKAMNSLFKAKAIPVPVTTDFLDWTGLFCPGNQHLVCLLCVCYQHLV